MCVTTLSHVVVARCGAVGRPPLLRCHFLLGDPAELLMCNVPPSLPFDAIQVMNPAAVNGYFGLLHASAKMLSRHADARLLLQVPWEAAARATDDNDALARTLALGAGVAGTQALLGLRLVDVELRHRAVPADAGSSVVSAAALPPWSVWQRADGPTAAELRIEGRPEDLDSLVQAKVRAVGSCAWPWVALLRRAAVCACVCVVCGCERGRLTCARVRVAGGGAAAGHGAQCDLAVQPAAVAVAPRAGEAAAGPV